MDREASLAAAVQRAEEGAAEARRQVRARACLSKAAARMCICRRRICQMSSLSPARWAPLCQQTESAGLLPALHVFGPAS